MPLWRGAQLKQRDNFTLPHFPSPRRAAFTAALEISARYVLTVVSPLTFGMPASIHFHGTVRIIRDAELSHHDKVITPDRVEVNLLTLASIKM
jgi:hypothetical protein